MPIDYGTNSVSTSGTIVANSGIFSSIISNNIPVSVSGHSHISSDITNFNSSVSGLLPVTDIVGGNNITVSQSGTIYTVAVTGSLGLTTEQVDDRVASLLVAGSGINLTYDDPNNFLTISTTGLQPSGNYSVVGHSHIISDVSGLQNALDNKQPSGSYSPLVHTHSSSNITDFSSSVDSLVSGVYAPLNNPSFSGIPTVPTASSGTNNSQIANTQFVRTEISNLVNSAPNTLDTLNELAAALGNDPNFATTIASGLANKASLIHNHTSNDITNFNSAVSGLLPSVSGNGYIVSNFANNIYSVSVTGLQPSGDYSLVGHTHTASNISDFNSVVSGLLPITNITAGNNITISQSGTSFTIAVTGSLGLTTEEIDDRVANLLVAGTGVSLSYNDPSNLLTVGVTGLIANPTNNRILTSRDSTTTGIDAESNLVFTGSNLGINTTSPSGALHVVGSGIVASAAGIAPNALFHLNSSVSGDNIFNVEGTNGSLFSVTDNLSGTLMSVNNSAGLPVLEVFSDDSVVAGRYNQNDFAINSSGNIGVGAAANNSYKLNVVGNANVSGVLSITGIPVSVSGHSHTSSDISNFNSSVSGLLPVTNITGGSNITVSQSGTIYTVAVTGSLGLTTEEVDDRVSNLLVAGTGIGLNYDDNANSLTIAVSGLSSTAKIGDGIVG